LNSINVTLRDSDGNAVNSSLNDTAGTINSILLNFTGLSDGNYVLNASVNDTAGNYNSTIVAFTLDTIFPIINVSENSSTTSSLGLSVTIAEYGSGISTCAVNRTGAIVNGSSNAWTINETDLSCGTEYNYNITCTDFAGNINSTLASYSTNSCPIVVTDTSYSGGGGGSSAGYWTMISSKDNEELSSKGAVNEVLGLKNKVNLKVGGVSHSVGVVDITSTSATINVSSETQQAALNVGDTKNFELTGDDYYDISVKLINVTNLRGNFVISPIHEKVVVQPVAENNAPAETPVAENNAPAETPVAENNAKGLGTITYVILIIIFVFVVLGLILYFMRRTKRKKHGFY
jgi:hypothetical protein